MNIHRKTYDKKIFTPRILFGDLGFLMSRAPSLRRALRNQNIGRAFTGKIMMVVTAVNVCTYCTCFMRSRP